MNLLKAETLSEPFETMLTGGHPNSLGRTIEVVELVLAKPDRFHELFECYNSKDEVVRLRVSSAMKRIEAHSRNLLIPYLDRFIDEIGKLEQPSAQWTLAQLFLRMQDDLSPIQRKGAVRIMKRNLVQNPDWIVLNMTMETLNAWAEDDKALKKWLSPQLERLSADSRKSVSKRAQKYLAALFPCSGG